jgi:ubiquinone/menaquinone biosynthesis C-methylase UbiE
MPIGDSVTFATDAATARYYEQRAAEYDQWYTGAGQFAARERPGWGRELQNVVDLIQQLPDARTLDVACGTGFLTRHLRGFALGIDQSRGMVSIARSRLQHGSAVVADALHLPVRDKSFDRVFTAHFYGHLPPSEQSAFFIEVRRVARELIVVDSARRAEVAPEEWQQRVLNDGSSHHVYKRYLTGHELADEIGGQMLLQGTWFVAARAVW